MGDFEPLTSTLRPGKELSDSGSLRHKLIVATDSLLVIRVIKSFPYRVVKNLVLSHVDLTITTVKDLKQQITNGISTARSSFIGEIQKRSEFKSFRNLVYDTLKIYVKAHEFKVPNFMSILTVDTKSNHKHESR